MRQIVHTGGGITAHFDLFLTKAVDFSVMCRLTSTRERKLRKGKIKALFFPLRNRVFPNKIESCHEDEIVFVLDDVQILFYIFPSLVLYKMLERFPDAVPLSSRFEIEGMTSRIFRPIFRFCLFRLSLFCIS